MQVIFKYEEVITCQETLSKMLNEGNTNMQGLHFCHDLRCPLSIGNGFHPDE